MEKKDVAVKKYVVRLSADERKQLEALIGKGKNAAWRQLKARILLQAEVSEAGEGWSDSRIIEALETSASKVYRGRKQLVEEGVEAVVNRKKRVTSPTPRTFDGEQEARLIAVSCSAPPAGRARWSLRLLEKQVVELKIVEVASDSTRGRVLKKHSQSPPQQTVGQPARSERGFRSGDGRCFGCLQTSDQS